MKIYLTSPSGLEPSCQNIKTLDLEVSAPSNDIYHLAASSLAAPAPSQKILLRRGGCGRGTFPGILELQIYNRMRFH